MTKLDELNKLLESKKPAQDFECYCIKERKSSKELHIFEGFLDREGKCSPMEWSACGNIHTSEVRSKDCYRGGENFRIAVAKIGRKVCGQCVATLYSTYQEE